MNNLKNAISVICLYLVGPSFFLVASLFALTSILQPDNIKQTLSDQDTYSKIVPAAVAANKQIGATSGEVLPMGEAWVTDIINKAFPPSDIEKLSSTTIDGVFKWLDGDTKNLDVTLDLTANKQNFAEAVGDYAGTRLAGLPLCDPQNPPATTDLLAISCRPPGLDQAVASKTVTADILNSEGFLKDPVINLGDTKSQEFSAATQPASDVTESLDSARTTYQQKDTILWALVGLTVFFVVFGVLLATSRRKATGRLIHSFGMAAIGLIILSITITVGAYLMASANTSNELTQAVAVPLAVDLLEQARTIYLIFAGIATAMAIVLAVIKRRYLAEAPAIFK